MHKYIVHTGSEEKLARRRASASLSRLIGRRKLGLSARRRRRLSIEMQMAKFACSLTKYQLKLYNRDTRVWIRFFLAAAATRVVHRPSRLRQLTLIVKALASEFVIFGRWRFGASSLRKLGYRAFNLDWRVELLFDFFFSPIGEGSSTYRESRRDGFPI